jgi:multidrug efflux pump subunit AcrA (membrane-fusion protein)
MVRPISMALVLAAAALAGCGSPGVHHHEGPEASPVAVMLTGAHEEKLDTLYRASGTVRGRTTAVLTSKTTGYVRSVDVRPGDRVHAGQVLAVLEANDSAASVRRARAGFDQSMESRSEAENGLLAAQAALRIAKSTHERVVALFANHTIAQQELDEADARLRGATAQEEMARARLRASSSRIDQAKAEVGEAQATLDYARITAPFAGQVIERRIDPGNLASPGMPLLVVEQEGKLRVETAVEESRAASVALGDTATVEIESLGHPVIGTVGEIVPTVDVASRAFLVKVDLPEDLHDLRPGMFARVGFRVGTRPRLVVPTTAITSSGALDRVFAAQGDRLRLRMVTLGEKQGPWTEVLSGLAPGERVVAAPSPALRDGALFAEQP